MLSCWSSRDTSRATHGSGARFPPHAGSAGSHSPPTLPVSLASPVSLGYRLVGCGAPIGLLEPELGCAPAPSWDDGCPQPASALTSSSASTHSEANVFFMGVLIPSCPVVPAQRRDSSTIGVS